MPVTFDTHKLITRLMHGQMTEAQAEAVSDALQEALEGSIGQLATKKDVEHVEKRLMIFVNIYGALTLAALGKMLFFK